MTCVVSIIENGVVHMAADSAGVNGYSLTPRRDPKLFMVSDFLFGFTTSFRMGQLLGYRFTAPIHHADLSVDQYMHGAFIDGIRETLKTGGYAKTDNGQESGGTFLVGYRGRLFCIESDFQIAEALTPFYAIGCGGELALGALHATQNTNIPAATRLRVALEAAEQFSAGVRGPFLFQQIGESQ